MNITGVNTTQVLSNLQNEKTISNAFKTPRDYKKYLADEYECLRSKDYSVAIDPSLLSQAMGDDKTKEWLEFNLSLIPSCYEKTKSFVESNGSKLLSYQTTFNADGSITTETCSQSEVDPGTEKARKELEERIEKRREEKRSEQKKAAERAEEKKLEEKNAPNSSTVSATGTDIWDVTEKIVSGISNTNMVSSAGTIVVGFDTKI